MSRSYRTAGTTLALLLVAAPLTAQQAMPPAQPQVPDSIQQIFMEFQTLQQRLATVQDSALRSNPELEEARQEVQEFVQEAIFEADSTLEQGMERLEAIQQQAQAAQAAQDTAQLRSLAMEMQGIQQTYGQVYAQAQAAALEREDVQARVESFNDRMMDAMAAIEPEAPQLADRARDLAARLDRFQQGG